MFSRHSFGLLGYPDNRFFLQRQEKLQKRFIEKQKEVRTLLVVLSQKFRYRKYLIELNKKYLILRGELNELIYKFKQQYLC